MAARTYLFRVRCPRDRDTPNQDMKNLIAHRLPDGPISIDRVADVADAVDDTADVYVNERLGPDGDCGAFFIHTERVVLITVIWDPTTDRWFEAKLPLQGEKIPDDVGLGPHVPIEEVTG